MQWIYNTCYVYASCHSLSVALAALLSKWLSVSTHIRPQYTWKSYSRFCIGLYSQPGNLELGQHSCSYNINAFLVHFTGYTSPARTAHHCALWSHGSSTGMVQSVGQAYHTSWGHCSLSQHSTVLSSGWSTWQANSTTLQTHIENLTTCKVTEHAMKQLLS